MYDWTDFQYTRFGRYAHRLIPALRGDRSEGKGRVTPILWHFTRFDGEVPFDKEIQGLIAMEDEIGHIPAWAVDVASQIDSLPHCGQINFPEPIFAICRGIAQERPDPQFLFCFEASSATKDCVAMYLEILKGWCEGQAQATALSRWPDHQEFIEKGYRSLGVRSQLKRLLVERVVLQCRFWIDALISNDGGILTIKTERLPPTPEWSRDGRADRAAEYQEQRLREVAEGQRFDVDTFLAEMAHPWLCHQRLYDQIDVILERIGREEGEYDSEEACENVQKAARRMKRTYGICIEALGLWLMGEHPCAQLRKDSEAARVLVNTYDVLGRLSAVKVWLASVLRKKIALFQEHDLAETLAV